MQLRIELAPEFFFIYIIYSIMDPSTLDAKLRIGAERHRKSIENWIEDTLKFYLNPKGARSVWLLKLLLDIP